MKALHLMTAAELRQEIAAGRLTSEELTRYYIDRIEAYDKPLGIGAVECIDPTAITQARMADRCENKRDKPLLGLPILVKDNIDVKGLPTTGGSFALCDNIAKTDAPVIANLRRAGAVILGKTNMTELANYVTYDMRNGYSSHGGQVVNIYHPDKDPGGSSTGSGVAMSAGFCAMAVGTDTSFSVVGCAKRNGTIGLKPPIGALSSQGIIPIAHTMDSAGALTRSFTDALMLYNGMRDKPLAPITAADVTALHIAVNVCGFDTLPQWQQDGFRACFDRWQQAGVTLSEVRHPMVDAKGALLRCEFRHDLEAYLASSSATVKTLQHLIQRYEANPHYMPYGIAHLRAAHDLAQGDLQDQVYLQALQQRETLRRGLKQALQGIDAVVMTQYSNVMHFAGLPSITLRLCDDDLGCPNGVILYGTDEEKLYAAALALEPYCPAPKDPTF